MAIWLGLIISFKHALSLSQVLCDALINYISTQKNWSIIPPWPTLEGLLTLWTRVIIVAFTSQSNLPELKNDWMAWTTSEGITGQVFFKNKVVNPSGPGIFSPSKENIVCWISKLGTSICKFFFVIYCNLEVSNLLKVSPYFLSQMPLKGA